MFGGVGKRAGWVTILVAGGAVLAGGVSARAADLGGDCCADLEERIAELEATTARKGNRKVSLEVSGWINEALMYWDDGFEENVYQVTNDNARSRFRFVGKAKISDDWSAGYTMEIGVRGANSKRSHQSNDDGCGEVPEAVGRDCGFDVRHSYWYLDSKTFGRLTVGHTGGAAEGVTEINLAHTRDIAKFSDVEDSGLGMKLRSSDGGLSNTLRDGIAQGVTWRRLIGDSGDQPGEGERRGLVKYDTPKIGDAKTIGQFTGTVTFGEDDYWDVGLRYAAELGGFKIAAGIAYGENTDISSTTQGRDAFFECLHAGSTGGISEAKCHQIGGSVSIMHVESGLYANFAAGQLTDELINDLGRFAGVASADDTSSFWAVEAGIEKKWIDLGKTTFFGQYYDHDGGASDRMAVAIDDPINPFFGASAGRIWSTGVEMVGGGVVQEISSAAMLLYAFYRHYEADLTLMDGANGTVGNIKDADLEDLDIVMSGAIIKF